MIGRSQAWNIARRFARDVGTRWGADVIAVLVIGSLASGTYRPGRSDIDTVVVLRSDAGTLVDEGLRALREHYRSIYSIPKGFGAVIVRQQDLLPPYKDADVIPEILRIKEQGKVVWGDINLPTIPCPSDEAIADYVDRFTAWLRANYIDHRPGDARTIDATVNTILYELRCWLWNECRIYVLDKLEVVHHASSVDRSNRFRLGLARLERYLNEGEGFADIVEVESLLKDVSEIVRNRK